MASHSLLEITAKSEGTRLRIAMFPWLAFGHIIPFLEYAKFLVQKGHTVVFISTPKNIDRLPKIPANLYPSIDFVKLRLPRVDGLPENAEATMDVHVDDVEYLKKAYDGLEPQLSQFLENSPPDLIIYDFAPYWLAEKSAKLDMCLNGSDPRKNREDFMVPPPWVPFDNKVAYRRYEVDWMIGAGKNNVSGISDILRVGIIAKHSQAVIIRHCLEFEGQWLKLLEELHNMKVIPLGLMPPPPPEPAVGDGSDDKNETWVSIESWLNAQGKGSVVYVALGSEVSLSQTSVTELALGLESSGVPFFWVLRTPAWSTETIELPDGYTERVKGRGIVWKGWAPQMKILNHESVGGFLTHCGWSSCVEGIVAGLPLIMLPFQVDQGINARVLSDKGVGIEIPRKEEDGSYTGDSVAESVRKVMIDDDGKKFRVKAKELSSIFADRALHHSYLEKSIN